MREFLYLAPRTIEEAVAVLGAGGARVLAGGTDLVPQLREGRRQVERIVDVKNISELTTVAALPDGGFAIGAAVSATRIARHRALAASHPAVAESVRLIGSLQVQNRASLGGNICNAAPSADGVPALICYGATARMAGPRGRRDCPLEEMFTGPGKTTLRPDELLISLTLPPARPRSATAYLRFTPRREMDIAIAGAATRIDLAGDGTIAAACIVLASVGPTPLRAPAAEAVLIGRKPAARLFDEAGQRAAADARPISDTRGSADYRRSLVAVLTARALAQCERSLIGEAARP